MLSRATILLLDEPKVGVAICTKTDNRAMVLVQLFVAQGFKGGKVEFDDVVKDVGAYCKATMIDHRIVS